jgi:rhodanese-related sulfurtransferase
MDRTSGQPFKEIDPAAAATLVAGGQVQILDVRTPGEYTGLGHIPGALSLPLDLIATAPATLARDDRPILLICEHGIRSAHAGRFLGKAGFTNLLNLSGGMSCWSGPRTHAAPSAQEFPGPSSWFLENADLLPRGGRALDVACGRGRHALLLAAAGFSVDAVDLEPARTGSLAVTAANLELPVQVRYMDLEAADDVDLGHDLYELILVTRYLHRPLFPALANALKPGGLLLYETFTLAQAQNGHPTNPDFLLVPGELSRLVAPLRVVRQREGEADGAQLAAVAARKGSPG